MSNKLFRKLISWLASSLSDDKLLILHSISELEYMSRRVHFDDIPPTDEAFWNEDGDFKGDF